MTERPDREDGFSRSHGGVTDDLAEQGCSQTLEFAQRAKSVAAHSPRRVDNGDDALREGGKDLKFDGVLQWRSDHQQHGITLPQFADQLIHPVRGEHVELDRGLSGDHAIDAKARGG